MLQVCNNRLTYFLRVPVYVVCYIVFPKFRMGPPDQAYGQYIIWVDLANYYLLQLSNWTGYKAGMAKDVH